MSNFLKYFKRKKLERDEELRYSQRGNLVDTMFVLYVNNEEPITFPCKSDLLDYLRRFRDANPISKLQVFRVESYSL